MLTQGYLIYLQIESLPTW